MPVVAWIGLVVALLVGLVVVYFVVGSIVEALKASRAQKTPNPAAATVEIGRKSGRSESRDASGKDAKKRGASERAAASGGEDEAILEAIRKLEKKSEKK